MRGLFGGFSGRPARRARGRVLAVLTAFTLAALTLSWPARSAARQACGVDFTLHSSVITSFPSIDCDTAEYKAVNKAKLDVMSQRDAYVCPAACPTLIEVTPPHITCVQCTSFQTPNGLRWDGAADAEGTYRCT